MVCDFTISGYFGTNCIVVDDEDSLLKGDIKAPKVFPAYERLQRVKKRYDPENIFNRWFSITPAA